MSDLEALNNRIDEIHKRLHVVHENILHARFDLMVAKRDLDNHRKSLISAAWCTAGLLLAYGAFRALEIWGVIENV